MLIKSFKRNILLLISIIACIFLFAAIIGFFIMPKKIVARELSALQLERETIPAYVSYGDLYVNSKVLPLSQICYNMNKDHDNSLREILYVHDGKAYFVYSASDGEHRWIIASIDIASEEVIDLAVFLNPQNSYYAVTREEYCLRSGYYYDGKIVISDFKTVLTYDIASKETKEYEYETFAFPTFTVHVEPVVGKEITLSRSSETRKITAEEIADTSNSFRQIYALKDQKYLGGSNYVFQGLVADVLSDAEESVYVRASFRNYLGETYDVILEYEWNSETFYYVANVFAGDSSIRGVYLVAQN